MQHAVSIKSQKIDFEMDDLYDEFLAEKGLDKKIIAKHLRTSDSKKHSTKKGFFDEEECQVHKKQPSKNLKKHA